MEFQDVLNKINGIKNNDEVKEALLAILTFLNPTAVNQSNAKAEEVVQAAEVAKEPLSDPKPDAEVEVSEQPAQ